MAFQIIRNDITKVKADAIVNTANPKPCIGSGTDSAVYAAAGEEQLLAERKKIGEIAPGGVACTPAFRLQAKYILHTVGPVWTGGDRGEREILRSCYAKSLALAAQLKCESIAFPLISSGVYGFPKDEALNIALSEIGKFLLTNEMKVLLVVLDRRALELSESLVGSIEQYIDEHEARSVREAEYRGASPQERRRQSAARRLYEQKALTVDSLEEPAEAELPLAAPKILDGSLPEFEGKSLDDVLGGAGDSFRQKLFKLIDESGMSDVAVYKKANVDRKVFSSIRCKKTYKPKKETALAFAIALQLDMPATLDLLSRAGFTFSPSDRFDLIVAYFITNGKYDIFEINAALFRYGEHILG